MDPSFTPQQWRGLNSPQPQSGYQKIEYKQKYIISNEKRLKKAGVIANERFINGDSSHKELGSNSLLNENEFEYGTMMEEYFSNQLSSHPSASNFSKANKNRLMQETGDILYVDNGNNFKLKAKSKSNRNFNYSQVNNDPDFSDKNNNNGIFQKSNEAMSTNDKSEFARQNNSKDQPKGRYTAVDRSASVNKSKPKNSKPEIDFGDNNVEIYEGDSFSIYNSPNHYDQSDKFNEQSVEYDVVEEIYQSINTSNIPDGTIEEASLEESSNEMQNHNNHENQIKNIKKYVKNSSSGVKLNIQGRLNKTDEKDSKIQSSMKNFSSSDGFNKEKNRDEYNNFIKGSKFNISNQNYQFEYEKYRSKESKSLLENKETAESPEHQFYTEEKYKEYQSHEAYDSCVKLENLQGDLDTLSRIEFSKKKKNEKVKTDCNTSFEKYVSDQIKRAHDYKSWYNITQPKNYKKQWKTKRQTEAKVDIDDRTVDEIISNMGIRKEASRDYLESFCHKYVSLNNSTGECFTERMIADIEKREKKHQELMRVEKAYERMHQRSLDKFEKEMCHRRLYTDAYLRTYKKSNKIKEKEDNEQQEFNKQSGTASK